MHRYEPSSPRAAFGIAAVALSAVTLGLFVVLPASLASERQEARLLAAPHIGSTAIREVAIKPDRIDVVVDCDRTMAFDRARQAMTKRDPSS